MTTTIDDDRLDETFAALANSTRRAMLARLAEGAATVNDLAEPFELTLPAISKHIKVLERAGLVQRGHRAQFRPWALDAAPLEQISTWAEQYRPVGKPASTGWTTTSHNSDPNERQGRDD
jgi:DNA-binding transcriptional ArsR family regulator